MFKKTKLILALALVAATPSAAYAGGPAGEQCVFTMHNGGWAYMSCLIGKFK